MEGASICLAVCRLSSKRPQGSGYIREQSGARESGPRAQRRVRRGSARAARPPESPPGTTRTHPHPAPAPPRRGPPPPQHQYGLLHRERLLQAGRGHPRHPAGRSRRQRRRCQNPGEFPGPHGPKEDQEQRERPEGPGRRRAWRSWGRAGRLGQRPQRRLGQN